MIGRYSLPQMQAIWEQENRFHQMMEVEICASEAMAELGYIPEEAAKNIREKASFNAERITEIEEVVKHDVIAFLTAIGENVGEESKYIHKGMTSSDVLDTALGLQLKESSELLLTKMWEFREVLAGLAKKYKYTIMMGRTHGIHAEPVTFGLKMALYVMEMDRDIKRLEDAKETVSVGMISGVVGTFANIDPRVEEMVCSRLGLKPEPVSTQIVQRDRHAAYMSTLAVIGSSLEKMATEIRNLQRTDILEVEESFAKGQKGSSAMPHKKNPITAERVAGLSRVLRGNATAALENVALWHERDITHSSVERIIIPDSCILLDYMLHLMLIIFKNLVVHEDNMKSNLEKTLGLIFSQRVLLRLIDKGMSREKAYEWVQRNALYAWQTKTDFEYLVSEDKDIARFLTKVEIDELFDYDYHLKHIDYIFERIGL
ncbi:MAG TPA: adenylosuccinate lyase [Clostridiales bacterium]|nr:adenylosuccinate lyase [Clostridiales bacterium]